jgi:ABC-type phosphate transport system permease subunit
LVLVFKNVVGLLNSHPSANIGVLMITTIACVAGFFIGFMTHLMLTQWAKRRQLDLIRVSPKWKS